MRPWYEERRFRQWLAERELRRNRCYFLGRHFWTGVGAPRGTKRCKICSCWEAL